MKLTIIISVILAIVYNQPILTTVDFTGSLISSLYSIQANPLGISMDLPEIIPYLSNNLFQQYILNSNAYGDWDANFQQHIHTPVGYKYNCPLVAELSPNDTVDCKMELNNTVFLNSLADYIWNTTIDYGLTFGWDPQASLFSSTNYTKNSFLSFFFDIYNHIYQVFGMQLADQANLYQQMGIMTSYTIDDYIENCNSINNLVYGIPFSGPGVTATANSNWYSKIKETNWYCGGFTFRSVIFNNISLITIENLLSDQYTSQYLVKRLNIDGVSYLDDVANYLVIINDIRFVEDGTVIDGVTNSFAAAIWAIDFSLEWFFMSGYRLDFYSSFKAAHQTILGSGPEFQPTHLYSALLFLNSAILNYPKVHKAVIVPGTSSSIKVYGLKYGYVASYGIIILNKDTSPSANGIVRIALSKQVGITCSYLSAPSLQSTSGATISGVHFASNHSRPMGDFKNIDYEIDGTGYYNIQVNYSQVVFCKSKIVASYKYFPTGQGAGEIYIVLSLLIVLLFF